jgi:hypothetical protein
VDAAEGLLLLPQRETTRVVVHESAKSKQPTDSNEKLTLTVRRQSQTEEAEMKTIRKA